MYHRDTLFHALTKNALLEVTISGCTPQSKGRPPHAHPEEEALFRQCTVQDTSPESFSHQNPKAKAVAKKLVTPKRVSNKGGRKTAAKSKAAKPTKPELKMQYNNVYSRVYRRVIASGKTTEEARALGF